MKELHLFLSMFILITTSGTDNAHTQGILPPGIVIEQSPGGAKYIGSPSIVILPDGSYLASHDWFGDDIGTVETTIFRSDDRGASWDRVAAVPYVHFASLFCHSNAVWLLGTSCNKTPSYISLHKSTDSGTNWTSASSGTNGKLFTVTSPSCAPTPVIAAAGRLWRAFSEEPVQMTSFSGFQTFFISAPADADLLNAENWTRTTSKIFDPNWISGRFPGWLECNAVEYPAGSGHVMGVARVDSWISTGGQFALPGCSAVSGIPRYSLAAMMTSTVSSVNFFSNNVNSWLDFPGGQSKFTIRYDSQSGKYWSVINKIANPHAGTVWLDSPMHQRNVLKLAYSMDLQTWTETATLIRWKEGESLGNTGRTGFHYADWQFDGDDIVYAVRNGWNANTYHDANYFTFHRIKDFRNTAVVAPDRGTCVFTTNSVGGYDGYVLEGGSLNSSATVMTAGDDAANRQYRAFLYFNTTDLPDDAIITSAMIKLRRSDAAGDPFATLGPCTVDIRNSSFNGSAALESADFNAAASACDVSEAGNPLNNGDWTAVPINTTGLQYINKTGATQFRVRFGNSTDTDGAADYVRWYTGDAAAGYKPELKVTYEYQSAFNSISAEDGYVIESSETSNIGGSKVSTRAGNVALRAGDDAGDRQYKTILSFDTSSLPDGAVITSARLKMTRGLQAGNPFDILGRCPAVDIKNGSFGAAGLEETDFEAAASVANVALLSNATSEGDTATAEIDISGFDSINKTGRTQFRIYFTTDDDDDGAYDYQAWYPGEHTGNKPVLEVTYR